MKTKIAIYFSGVIVGLVLGFTFAILSPIKVQKVYEKTDAQYYYPAYDPKTDTIVTMQTILSFERYKYYKVTFK